MGKTGEGAVIEGVGAGVAAGERKTRGEGVREARVEAEAGTEEEKGEAGVERGIEKIRRDDRRMKRGS